MANYKFGNIDGVKEGDTFKDRVELREAGIHNVLVAGIDGNKDVGCCSIVLNGGYVDDLDLGNEIIYTGHGGNDTNTNKQIADQSWDSSGNKALIVSEIHGLPVRVTRGYKHKSKYSPSNGYQYGGLYIVTEHFEEVGKNGFKICRYRLQKIESDIDSNIIQESLPVGNKKTTRSEVTTLRIVRDTELARKVKQKYNYECQFCGIIIEVNGVRYAEAAHIRPLGNPHNGEDTPENIICLCPNHHVMFDKGIIAIDKNLNVIGIESTKLTAKHDLDINNLSYHYEHIFMK